jgi:hypothetical protein
MAASCPTAHHGAGANCQQDCCRYPLPQAISRSSRNPKPKAVRAPLFPTAPAIEQGTHLLLNIPPPGDLIAAAPDRHILLQVFRI